MLQNGPGEVLKQCSDRPSLTAKNYLSPTSYVLLFITFHFIIAFAFPVKAKPAHFTAEPDIRVCLSDNSKNFVIKINGTYKVIYENVCIATVSNISVKCASWKKKKGNAPFKPILYLPNQKIEFTQPIKFVPVTDSISNTSSTTKASFVFNEQVYPGDIELIPTGTEDILIINIIGLETYLRGVVPNELVNHPTNEDLQAFMAQAIAARNYAIYKIAKEDTGQFDVYADTRDQVYSGIAGYRSLADSAVRMTAGVIVEYKGMPAKCFFHSTCGGHTERVQNVWQGQPALPYLQGVSDIDSSTGAPFCIDSPHFYWTHSFPADTLDHLMKKYLTIANPTYTSRAMNYNITDINIVDRFPSFRVDTMKITTLDGKTYFVRGDRIRYLFRQADGSLLRSDMFRIEVVRNKYGEIKELVLKGQGNGHGVGMCQWGAIGMSRKGYNYKEILSHYFPGTTINKIY